MFSSLVRQEAAGSMGRGLSEVIPLNVQPAVALARQNENEPHQEIVDQEGEQENEEDVFEIGGGNEGGSDASENGDGEYNLLMEADTAILAAAIFRQHQRLYGQDGTARMNVSEEELQWARKIKTAIEGSDDLDNLTDFMYAQYAIKENGDVQAALNRAQMMQEFRQEYGVLDTVEDALRYLTGLVDMMPGLFLSFSFNQGDGNYAVVSDLCKFDMSEIRTPERLSRCFKGAYYLLHALNPDLEAVRRGDTFLCECQGYQWKKDNMFDAKTFEKGWRELFMVYPCRFNQIKYFHTGLCFNLLASMSKRYLPPESHNKIQFGCNFMYRLDSMYFLPSMEDANQRIVSRFEHALQRRFHYERFFSLDTAEPASRNTRVIPSW